jgi:putative membrane protein
MPIKVVLAIDRDDDLGRKANIKSPVIGREENLNAAIALAASDPEDSDINTIFGALKIYDELKKSGEDVEVVTVCGNESVGVISDTKIAAQLDEIKEKLGAKSVVVVTDGSEDEVVLPIITSRFKIDAVSRIVVKQSKTIESTYFTIKRMLDDPKIARITLAPLGIILLVYAVFLLANYPSWGSGAIIFFIGFYLVLKAYGLENAIEDYFSTLKKSLFEGRMSFITYVTSAMLLIIGAIQGFNSLWKIYTQPVSPGILMLVVAFIYGSVWWIVGAGISAMFGKILDLAIERKPFRRHLVVPFLLISGGLVLWGTSIFILSNNEVFKISSNSAFEYLLLSIAGAILIAFVVIVPLAKRG